MNSRLTRFKHHCERWQQERQTQSSHNYRGRANVIAYLSDRYGVDSVKRHKKWIVRALNNAEGVQVADH